MKKSEKLRFLQNLPPNKPQKRKLGKNYTKIEKLQLVCRRILENECTDYWMEIFEAQREFFSQEEIDEAMKYALDQFLRMNHSQTAQKQIREIQLNLFSKTPTFKVLGYTFRAIEFPAESESQFNFANQKPKLTKKEMLAIIRERLGKK